MHYSVGRVNWKIAASLLKNVREKVFICEKRIPKRVEFDFNDKHAFHILVCDDESQEPIATGRLLETGEISRIAVTMPFRAKHVDKIVISGLISIATELNLKEIYINSPLESVSYFNKHNFRAQGAVFMEAGLPKQRMSCAIKKFNSVNYSLMH
jgi:predicted GNAT family N-acyltransferase